MNDGQSGLVEQQVKHILNINLVILRSCMNSATKILEIIQHLKV